MRLGVPGAALLLAAAPFSFRWSPAMTLPFSPNNAEARTGRPRTPPGVGGVNRRAQRRAYYAAFAAGTGVAGAAAAGASYNGPACGHYPYRPCC